jgi:drug/metabolite transporter (DMT)-like permease
VSTVEPVYIVVLAAVFLDQRLAPLQLDGAALVHVGVVVAQTAPRSDEAAEPATPLDAEAVR